MEVHNALGNTYYEFSLNGGEYIKVLPNDFPTIQITDDIKIRIPASQSLGQSETVHITPVAKVFANRMLLNGKIGFKFYVISRGELSARINGDTATVNSDNEGEYILFTVAPKELMTAKAKIELSTEYGNVETVIAVSDILDQYGSLSDYKNLMQSLQDYSGAANMYFNKSGDFESDKSTDNEILSHNIAKIKGDLPQGVVFFGTSITLEDTISIRHYFSVEENLYGLQHFDGNIYYAEIDDISILDITKSFEYSIGDCTVCYSVLTYASQILASENNSTMAELMRTIYKYYVEMQKITSFLSN